MDALRIRTTVTSPTLNLPELAGWLGKTVNIIIVEEKGAEAGTARGRAKPLESVQALQSKLPGDPFEGFDQTLRQWRSEPWRDGDKP